MQLFAQSAAVDVVFVNKKSEIMFFQSSCSESLLFMVCLVMSGLTWFSVSFVLTFYSNK